MGRHVWGYWDCQYCGATVIRGDKTECPHCGHARDQQVRFYMREEELEYVPPAEEKKEQNWFCAYCENQNPWELTECAYCGAKRDEREGTYFEPKPEVPQPEPTPPPTPEPEPPKPEPLRPIQPVRRQNNDLKKKLLKLGALVLSVLFLIWLFTPVTRTVKIEGFSWEREIQIEEYKTVQESDWSVPTGGRLQRTSQEIRSYRQVLDHYEDVQVPYQVYDHDDISYTYRDLGNGQFEEVEHRTPVYRTEYRTEQKAVYRQEPIYATKYYYEIERWKYAYSLKTSADDQSPYWHELPVLQNDGKPGSQRVGKKTEHYYITVPVNQKTKQVELPYQKWSDFAAGQTITYKSFRFSRNPIGDEIDLVE